MTSWKPDGVVTRKEKKRAAREAWKKLQKWREENDPTYFLSRMSLTELGKRLMGPATYPLWQPETKED